MLRPLTFSLSTVAIVVSSFPLSAEGNSLTSSFPQLFSQAPQTVPEVIVDTIPIENEPSPTPQPEDVVVESKPSNPNPTPTANDRRFTCEYNNGQYTVMYNPQSQPNQSYPWAIPQQMGGNWSPERRCNAISDRLENYRPDGLLELQTSVINNQNVVCVTTQNDPSCRIVFTVPKGQDPILTRDRVFENLASANQGQQTQGVTTYTSNSSLRDLLGGRSSNQASQQSNDSINLRPFLDRSDGGTGNQLRSNSSPSRLNPNLFR
ncbi:COP23 domain-containing protein [Dactylococcopsis salina]|uniref:Circadian oscillating protein COP23 n=1 Tax=Dactylococcopsis salina (strain PCC 8305) TaxID=13035 RepID=K9YRR9_DACS8|nr:COP23 domain-containing protein [Dactylococcopsis salina]AFZ49651.1 hypothetical protein Dacsa_0919 [Dactylococcopsis salina PCC 8305]